MELTKLVSGGNVRTHLGDITKLLLSINFQGIVVPVSYYRVGEKIVVWDGHRRLRCAQIINQIQGIKGTHQRFEAVKDLLEDAHLDWMILGEINHGPITDIPTAEMDPPEGSVEALRFQLLSAQENLREPLNPMDEARALSNLVEASSVRDVAKSIGQSDAYVSRRSRLVDLHPQFQRAVADGKLKPRAAEALLTAPDMSDEDREALIAAKTFRAISARVRALSSGVKVEPDVTPVDDPLLEAYREEWRVKVEQVVTLLNRLKELHDQIDVDITPLEKAVWMGKEDQCS